MYLPLLGKEISLHLNLIEKPPGKSLRFMGKRSAITDVFPCRLVVRRRSPRRGRRRYSGIWMNTTRTRWRSWRKKRFVVLIFLCLITCNTSCREFESFLFVLDLVVILVDLSNIWGLYIFPPSQLKERRHQEKLADQERMLRDKLVRSYKSREEDRMEQQREKVRKAVQGKVLLIPS